MKAEVQAQQQQDVGRIKKTVEEIGRVGHGFYSRFQVTCG